MSYIISFDFREMLFRLPEKRSCPVIMVGPGTGIAPFRSFWQERLAVLRVRKGVDNLNGDTFGNMILLFGCRKATEDMYKSETIVAVEEGALTKVLTAFSREQNVPKVMNILVSNLPSSIMAGEFISQDCHLMSAFRGGL